MKRLLPLAVIAAALLLSACTNPGFSGCNDVSCRPVSEPHALSIWWQPDMRNGPYDYTKVSVNK